MGEMDQKAIGMVLGQLDDYGRAALRHLLSNAVAPVSLASRTLSRVSALDLLHETVCVWLSAIDQRSGQ